MNELASAAQRLDRDFLLSQYGSPEGSYECEAVDWLLALSCPGMLSISIGNESVSFQKENPRLSPPPRQVEMDAGSDVGVTRADVASQDLWSWGGPIISSEFRLVPARSYSRRQEVGCLRLPPWQACRRTIVSQPCEVPFSHLVFYWGKRSRLALVSTVQTRQGPLMARMRTKGVKESRRISWASLEVDI
jgi:hypothetical protein